MKNTSSTPDISLSNGCANEQSSAVQQFLTFTVGEEEYGVDIMLVREIKGWAETTRLPNSAPSMLGVINLRGTIVPIFDLRARFNLGSTEPNPKNVFIILMAGDRTVGILVDTVSDILNTTADSIKPAPQANSQIDDQYINGLISVDNRMVVLLDISRLFDSSILEQLNHS